MRLPLLFLAVGASGCGFGLTSNPSADGDDSAVDGDADTDAGDSGTVTESRYPVYGDLLINEIQARPTGGVPEDKGEWFELRNFTALVIKLDGVTVTDQQGGSVTITNDIRGDAATVPPGDLVVLCVEDDYNANGGVLCDITWSWSILKVDTADRLVLTYNSAELDRVEWRAEWFEVEGASIGVRSSATDPTSNDNSADWCPQLTALKQGNYGTPGAVNDGC